MPAEGDPVSSLRATRAVVDLDAVASNVREFRRLVRPSDLIAVVKGDAYGHGAAAVSGAAIDAGASRLAVYTLDEAQALREAGLACPIIVLGPLEEGEAQAAVSLGVGVTVWDMPAIARLEEAAGRHSVDVHVEIDTGLTRAGAAPRDAVVLARRLAHHPSLRLESVFTHFASADEREAAPTEKQLRVFLEAVAAVESYGIRIPFTHASNTAGALNFPHGRLGAVRVGIGLYGYDPSPWRQVPIALRPALQLRSRVTRRTAIEPGTGVGYGHEFRATSPCVIGLVPIGYADGLSRQLGWGRGRALIRGQAAPIVGRVSMDQITVDMTHIHDASVGDEVVLIGRSGDMVQTAENVADQAGTISYEVLTALLPRVPRVYVREGRPVAVTRLGRLIPVPLDA